KMENQPTRKKNLTVPALVAGSALCLLAGAGLNGAIQHYARAEQTPAAPVVNVATTQVRKTAQGFPFDDDDPMSQFWQRFFGGRMPRGQQRQQGLGSGFIIDRNGTILTNYHVVDGAQKISVTLSDGNSYDAKVIGKDQKTDIAV